MVLRKFQNGGCRKLKSRAKRCSLKGNLSINTTFDPSLKSRWTVPLSPVLEVLLRSFPRSVFDLPSFKRDKNTETAAMPTFTNQFSLATIGEREGVRITN